MNRTLVIGDIHGGLIALKEILEKAMVTSSDHLIFLGDYVDGWSDSAQVIEYLIPISQTNKCTFIYGNHDAWCHDWLRGGIPNDTWLMHGGKATIESYNRLGVEEWAKHKEFFDSMTAYHIDGKNRLFIHAGFTSLQGPTKEHHKTNFYWDRTLWETALTSHELSELSQYYPKRLKLFNEIFIGHTPTTKWNFTLPWNRANVWNIDTGAAFKGKLSIMDIDSREIWQSENLYKLYPKESGRNKTTNQD
ncbi:MAG: serine/threonine protein phosphatase 1 [Crocinitomicaceae bacterium]|jgi:serine/threonine protein phosphatase 1